MLGEPFPGVGENKKDPSPGFLLTRGQAKGRSKDQRAMAVEKGTSPIKLCFGYFYCCIRYHFAVFSDCKYLKEGNEKYGYNIKYD